MSLENKIDKLTETMGTLIPELIAALESGAVRVKTTPEIAPKVVEDKPAPEKAVKKPATKAEPEATTEESNVKPIKEVAPVSGKAIPTRDDVRAALLEFKKVFDQKKMYALISEVADGATTFPQMADQHYQKVIDVCKARIKAAADDDGLGEALDEAA